MIIEQSSGGPRITKGVSTSIILAALSMSNIVVDSLTVTKSILLLRISVLGMSFCTILMTYALMPLSG